MSRATISNLERGVIYELGMRKFIKLVERLGLQVTLKPSASRPTLQELIAEREKKYADDMVC